MYYLLKEKERSFKPTQACFSHLCQNNQSLISVRFRRKHDNPCFQYRSYKLSLPDESLYTHNMYTCVHRIHNVDKKTSCVKMFNKWWVLPTSPHKNVEKTQNITNNYRNTQKNHLLKYFKKQKEVVVWRFWKRTAALDWWRRHGYTDKLITKSSILKMPLSLVPPIANAMRKKESSPCVPHLQNKSSLFE